MSSFNRLVNAQLSEKASGFYPATYNEIDKRLRSHR